MENAKESYMRQEKDATVKIVASMSAITQFYPRHIAKEDKHFFIPVMNYYTPDEKEQMLQEFIDFDSKLIHEMYAAVVQKLELR